MGDYTIPVLVTLAVFAAIWFFLRGSSVDYSIIPVLKDGQQDFTYPGVLPKSVNRPAGIEFSYTGWLKIDDFTYRYGTPRIIFVKGTADLSEACPALVIDANTNTLLVKVDTFGAQETISVVSVPAKKWLHIGISVNQEAVDVYINGIMYAHHTLSQLPKQNSGTVLTSPGGGFAGQIVNLEYHPQVLTADSIASKAGERPPVGKDDVFPPYFDMSWFNH